MVEFVGSIHCLPSDMGAEHHERLMKRMELAHEREEMFRNLRRRRCVFARETAVCEQA
jgi:hypothetical protein